MSDSERIRNKDIQEALDDLFPIDFTTDAVLPTYEQEYVSAEPTPPVTGHMYGTVVKGDEANGCGDA